MVLFNDGNNPGSCDITLGSEMHCEAWSPADGSITQLAVCEKLPVALEAQELRCLRFLPGATAGKWAASAMSSLPSADGVSTLLDGVWNFAVDECAASVLMSIDAGWEEQGFASFSGTGVYFRKIAIETDGEWLLEVPEAHTAVSVRIDGRLWGAGAGDPTVLRWGGSPGAPTVWKLPCPIRRPTAITATHPIRATYRIGVGSPLLPASF
ncbi:hypothetical protein T190_07535 [Sinorhizobium meliloti CCBAU 01290]|nr:hypothetical protein T190_07535 [Sinorhizobium meliloti CCBAU 01290]